MYPDNLKLEWTISLLRNMSFSQKMTPNLSISWTVLYFTKDADSVFINHGYETLSLLKKLRVGRG